MCQLSPLHFGNFYRLLSVHVYIKCRLCFKITLCSKAKHVMFTILILFSILTIKSQGICERHQNNPYTQRILLRQERPPSPHFLVPRSATGVSSIFAIFKQYDSFSDIPMYRNAWFLVYKTYISDTNDQLKKICYTTEYSIQRLHGAK